MPRLAKAGISAQVSEQSIRLFKDGKQIVELASKLENGKLLKYVKRTGMKAVGSAAGVVLVIWAAGQAAAQGDGSVDVMLAAGREAMNKDLVDQSYEIIVIDGAGRPIVKRMYGGSFERKRFGNAISELDRRNMEENIAKRQGMYERSFHENATSPQGTNPNWFSDFCSGNWW